MTCTLSPYWYLRAPRIVENPKWQTLNRRQLCSHLEPAVCTQKSVRSRPTDCAHKPNLGFQFETNCCLKNHRKMPNVLLNKHRSARVRTSSNPLSMGSCFSNIKSDEGNDQKIVRVEEGLVEGSRLITKQGVQCDVFLGIPYAKPPLGELRFQKPQPAEKWPGIRKCTKFPNRSIYKEMPWDKAMIGAAAQSEDCLYLNVFAPKIREDHKYPVLFYIHGGGWMMDSAERYTPKNICRLLVSRDIIVVTMHYRLGFLGFLSTGDDVCPGNFGLYDMLEALKWTTANISSFGGDPNNITLSGQSAGAAAADLLSLSPLSKGLFARKIVMGGNSYCHWATEKKTDIREYCRRKALKMGWKPKKQYSTKREESQHLLEFYKNAPASKLGTTMWFSKTIFTECRLPLAPVVDGEILPDEIPILQKQAHHVPSMIGGGEHEALLFYAIGLMRGSEKEINAAIDVFSRKTGLATSKIEAIMKKFYGDSSALRSNSKLRRRLVVDLISDVFVNYGNYKFLKDCQTNKVECYAYSFDYQSRQMWGWLQHVVPFTGGTHTSDVAYLFDCNYMAAPLGMTKLDRKISDVTCELFTNFVKFGTPNGFNNDSSSSLTKWKPISINDGDQFEMFCFKEKPEMMIKSHMTRMQRIDDEFDFSLKQF